MITKNTFWDVQTAFVKCKHILDFSGADTVWFENNYKIYASDGRSTDQTKPDQSIDNFIWKLPKRTSVYLGYNGELDRDPEYVIKFDTEIKTPDNSKTAHVTAVNFSSAFNKNQTASYSDRYEYPIITGDRLYYNESTTCTGGFCIDYWQNKEFTSAYPTSNFFRHCNYENKGFISLNAHADGSTNGVGDYSFLLYSQGNSVVTGGDPCLLILYNKELTPTGMEVVSKGPYVYNDSSISSYDPRVAFERFLHRKNLNVKATDTLVRNLCSVDSSIEWNDYDITGNFGVLFKEVTMAGSSGAIPSAEISKTISSVSADSLLPLVYLNTSESSYVVDVSSSAYKKSNNQSAPSVYEIENELFFIPSYRFKYDYLLESDPFSTKFEYKGKFAVPVNTSTFNNDEYEKKVKALVDQEAIDDTGYTSKENFLKNTSNCCEWPALYQTASLKHGLCSCDGNNWLAFIDDVKYLPQSLNNGWVDPYPNYKLIKSGRLHVFRKSGVDGNETVYPAVFKKNDAIPGCINSVPDTVVENGKIRNITAEKCKNLFDIYNIHLLSDTTEFGNNDVSAYYNLSWSYKESNSGGLTYTPVSLGTIKIQRLQSSAKTKVIYNDASSIEFTGSSAVSAKNASGSIIDKICFINPNSVSFDAVSVSSNFKSFVGDYTNYTNKDDITLFFRNTENDYSKLFNYRLMFGKDGLFSSVNTPINYDSIGSTGYEKITPTLDGKTVYNVFDSIDWDVSVAPKISSADASAMVDIGINDINNVMIPSDLKTGWYMWIDKTATMVDPNIKLEILDCKGLNDDGIWTDCNILDITELCRNSNGQYCEPESKNINKIFESNSINFHRVKVRFRMVCEGDTAPLNESGYAVHLGYSVKNQNDKTADFPKLHTNYINPLVVGYEDIGNENVTGRTYYCSINGRRDELKNTFGLVYGKTLESFNNKMVIISANDKTKTLKGWLPDVDIKYDIWRMDDIENDENSLRLISEPTSNNDETLYYVKTTWSETNGVRGNDNILCKVIHGIGTYFKSKTSNNFDFDITGTTFMFMDSVGWNQNGNYYVEVNMDNYKSFDVSTAIFSEETRDSQISIFDIDTSMASNEVSLRVVGNVRQGDRYSFRIGSLNVDPVLFTGGDFDYLAFIDKDKMSTNINGDKYIRLIITKEGTTTSEIPLSYIMTDEDLNGNVSFGIGYYEFSGGIMVKFRDYKQLSINTNVVKTPDLNDILIDNDHPQFYIVNGFKNLSFGVVSDLSSVSTDPQNDIILQNTKTSWTAHWVENYNNPTKAKIAWSTPEDSIVSINSSQASIRLTSDNFGVKVGMVKYRSLNNALLIEGKFSYTYDIKIGGSIRKRVTSVMDNIISDGFFPIRVCVEPLLYFMSNVITYKAPIFVINETNNEFVELGKDDQARKIYSNFELTTNTGETWTNFSADDPVYVKCSDFDSDTSVIVSVVGALAGDWVKNDEKLSYINASNKLVLNVLNGSEYDESVTRVVGGFKLKYPNSRESILFSPNEWITADNLNLRFKKITENLLYLEKQTKFYLKPPSMYVGYYGDFNVTFHGSYQRIHGGFVPVQDKTIYYKFNENTSIDDNDTYLKGCLSIASSKSAYGDCNIDDLENTLSQLDVDNNLYVCLGDKIRIVGQSTYAQNTVREDIVPKQINEMMDSITRIFYSNDQNLLYCLSPKTHKIYIFNRYKYNSTGEIESNNATYYGEIGGYGGATAKNKFNHPNDFFVSSVKDSDGNIVDEIWVCDGKNRVIKHFTIKGQWINTIDLSVIDYDILSVCVDYKNQVHALTNNYVFTFTSDGDIIRAFPIDSRNQTPLMIRPQYKAGFLYVLYEHRVSKYSFDGKFIADFAENDELTYTCICPTKCHDIFIGTTKNVLQYSDILRVATIAETRNAKDFCWSLDEINLNKNENIQDAVLNTSFQRMYDNIRLFSICLFGKILDEVVNIDDSGVVDFDKSTFDGILSQHHKEQIFVGINEFVTLAVINRSLSQMCDLLDLMLKSI